MKAPVCPNDRPLTREELDALAAWHDARCKAEPSFSVVSITIHGGFYGAADVARALRSAGARPLDWQAAGV